MKRCPIPARLLAALAVMVAGAGGVGPASAQMATNAPPVVAGARPVTIERIRVSSPAIRGNLEENSAERPVLVMLPPGYRASGTRRYPVVYALHGYSIGAEQWIREIHAPATVEGAFAKGTREMIVVFPDSKTLHNGSMYSRSVTTGDFETFVARDLVRYVDAHYRTIADRRSRGLAGHSMGGYGTIRIGMKHPDIFGALYAMSPCCLSAGGLGVPDAGDERAIRALRRGSDGAALPWAVRAKLATAAAWSPDPDAPPLFADLPVKDGVPQPDVLARWAANAPLALVDQHVADLRRYRAIAVDVGDQDGLRDDAARFHRALDRYRIANGFQVYPGTHISNVAFRMQDAVMPFFGRVLDFGGR